MKNKRLLFIILAVVILLGVLAGGSFWFVEQYKEKNTEQVQKKPRPSGEFTDLKESTSDTGLVVKENTDVDTVKGVDSELKSYFNSQKSQPDEVRVYATQGKYAVGETNFVTTLWGPGEDGSIQPLAYSDIGLFSCDELDRVNTPVKLVGGKCYEGSGGKSEGSYN